MSAAKQPLGIMIDMNLLKTALLITFAFANVARVAHAAPCSLDELTQEQVLKSMSVRWQAKNFKCSDLPEGLGKGPVAAIESWAAWSLEHEYQMHLVKDKRVLLISPKDSSKLARHLKLIDDTAKEFDKLAPAPPREEIVLEDEEEGAPDSMPEEELPEDPEGGPAGWSPDDEEPLPFTFSYEWGAGTWPVDTETCVMFVVHDEKDYSTLVDTLVEKQDYLAEWAKTGKTQTGFVHERPLVAAYIENASGMEEWDPDNEVVHRVAQMLFVRRFSSQQPYWLVQGTSWYIEMKLRKAIYVYPYRDEFVFATEHTAWDSDLTNTFNDREEDPVRPEEFTAWNHGSYQGGPARLSYGLVGFIARYHPDAFGQFLEDLRLFAMEDNRVELGNGDWERASGYVISSENQMRLGEQHFRESFLKDAADYFRKGKKFKLKKK
ncbi:MAG: hypothetical protein ACI8X5_003913 [Planctomycetota bacterium]|jgi:hypothetical protein